MASTSASSSTSASAAAPTPPFKLPWRLPCSNLHSEEFEYGYDDALVEGGISGLWVCNICKRFPRRPVYLKGCNHVFCETCIRTAYETATAPKPAGEPAEVAKCPSCRDPYELEKVRYFEQWPAILQRIWKEKEVRCPNSCGFKGDFSEVDEHEVYRCPRRLVHCPSDGCHYEDEAGHLETEHLPTCPHLRQHCRTCHLPILVRDLASHNCIASMRAVVYRVFIILAISH
jgi:hypothetical protein